MEAIEINHEEERKQILSEYRELLRLLSKSATSVDNFMVRKAFDLALEAHRNMRRKSGEPYIFHPLAVAKIVAQEMGLGTTSVVCALMHDTVEDSEITLEDIDGLFGEKVAKIIDGLTKISGVTSDLSNSLQAENFRKMLLTLSDDVRVILIKIADRLHNMRTLGSMPAHKKRKIASETLFLYAPLAHRLGLYAIKSELEDLGLKHTEPDIYEEIEQNLRKTKEVRERFIRQFILPIERELNQQKVQFEVKGRTKSVHSIWNKMRKKNIPIEEVYDLFAIRIIVDTPIEMEKAECWKVYSIVTDFYKPKPDRLRDWITTPKRNGYESLHCTVMSPGGKWVEVQVRSSRMDKIAEKGYAAHWKYKNVGGESYLDEWINKIREVLENPDPDALDFIDDFKLNLFSQEIYVFTPNGELKNLPTGATALDFAFEIHTQIGEKCIGAKVNQKLVPLSYALNSGDQVEIITSNRQKVNESWLNFVVTGKAKTKIKSLLKEDRRRFASDGKEILARKFKSAKIPFNEANIHKLSAHYNLENVQELFYRVALDKIDLKALKNFNKEIDQKPSIKTEPSKNMATVKSKIKGSGDILILGENMEGIDYKLAPCCNPIPGDDIFGFITINSGIKIHRTNCSNAIQLMSNYAYRIVRVRWASQEMEAFLAGILITGLDDVGILNKITLLISDQLHVNMRSLNFESNDGIFEGKIMLFVHDTSHLENLMNKIKKVEGVINAVRIDHDKIK